MIFVRIFFWKFRQKLWILLLVKICIFKVFLCFILPRYAHQQINTKKSKDTRKINPGEDLKTTACMACQWPVWTNRLVLLKNKRKIEIKYFILKNNPIIISGAFKMLVTVAFYSTCLIQEKEKENDLQRSKVVALPSHKIDLKK